MTETIHIKVSIKSVQKVMETIVLFTKTSNNQLLVFYHFCNQTKDPEDLKTHKCFCDS
jgi:hypothetical protein